MRFVRVTVVLVVAAAGVANASACGSFSESDAGSPSPTIDAAPASDSPSMPPSEAGECVLSTAPATLAGVAGAPSKLASNGEHVFWIEDGARLMRASLRDCQTREIANGKITALAVDAQWIVWGDPGYHVLGRDAVDQQPQTAVTNVSPSLILGAGVGFWLGTSGIVACNTPCKSTSIAALVGAPRLLAANVSTLLVFGLSPDAGTTVDLWSHQISLFSGTSLVGPLATNQDPTLLAANPSSVFWVSSNGQLHGVPTSAGPPIVLPIVAGARALAVDDAFVYVATSDTIGRVPVNGGTLTAVLTGEADITSLVVTEDSLVWATAAGIRRVRK